MSAFIDHTGKRYHMLTVVKRAKNNGRYVQWLCRCDCGNWKRINANQLGWETKSCGCVAESRRLPIFIPGPKIGEGLPTVQRIMMVLGDRSMDRRSIAIALHDIPMKDVYSRISSMAWRGLLAKSDGSPIMFSVSRTPYKPGRPTKDKQAVTGEAPRQRFDLQSVWRL